MKTISAISFLTVISCAFILCGCATTGQNAQTANTLTLEDTLQKSAEIRGKVESAKANYSAAKEADAAKSDDASVTDQAKAAVKEKVDAVKTQVQAEADAWKDAVK